ncbi:hypothetical protein [Lactococcus lactis]|uniref:Uncharacterized protein n=1 Tax=Lactococcus lactis subsp. lactis TaxID=1360 RepID=A0AAF0W386_LACLL|nr:hypothetical protein [Lactococcus lactis]ARE09505.1 hypothetical protein LLUC77_2394 [Lactococcus lactis subsp. lactis]MRK42619.1 hypothetical protein [Lactococcus lactis subsp. lactis]WNS48358.1 hypothetical protein LL229_02930 [Lactococcus lactis subsp. lactis]
MKFKAKPAYEAPTEIIIGYEELEPFEGFYDLLDDEGYVHGYYVDGYIIGGIAEVTDEYFQPEFWCPIDKSTLAAIGGDDDNY